MASFRKSLYDERAAGAVYSGTAVLSLIFLLLFAVALNTLGISVPTEGAKPDWYLYCAYILPQLSFAVAIVLFFIFTDAKPKEVYQGAKWQYFLIAAVLQFGLFSLSGLNTLFLKFLGDTLGYASSAQIPSVAGWKIIPVIIVVAVLPAIFEESIFRGILLSPLKKVSTPVAVGLCGALFALYHQSPAQTIYQFCCGCAFALVTIRAGSVLPTMLSHFLNNAVIIALYFFGIDNFTGVGGTIFYILSAVALAGTLAYLIFFDKAGNTKKTESAKPFLLTASVGIAVCGVLWISNLLAGIL